MHGHFSSRNIEKTYADQSIPIVFFYSVWKETTHKPSKVAAAKNFFSRVWCWYKLFRLMLFIKCDDWEALFFLKDYRYSVAFLDPRRTEGPIKPPLSLSVCQFGVFLSSGSLLFSWFLARWKIIGIFKNWQRPFFLGKFIFAQIWAKWAWNRIFWIFSNILSLVFLGNNLKWKLILLLIFHHHSHI